MERIFLSFTLLLLSASATEDQGKCSANPSYDYVGCILYYTRDPPILAIRLPSSSTNTPEECMGRCRAKKYRFAGADGHLCFCGQLGPWLKYTRPGRCTRPCPGDPAEKCGGSRVVSVYFLRENGFQWARAIESKDFDTRFPASNVLYDVCDGLARPSSQYQKKSYWLSPNITAGSSAFFIVELNCNQVLDRVILKNTQNGWRQDRGTENFTVSLSDDKKIWTPVVNGTLPDIRGLPCNDRPLDATFRFMPQNSTFAKFEVMSYYGFGGGLDYFEVTGQNDLNEGKGKCNASLSYDYLGCFWEYTVRYLPYYKVLPVTLPPDRRNTPEKCIANCRNKRYRFAGVQEELCFCGQLQPWDMLKVNESWCNDPCTGNANRKCGGIIGRPLLINAYFIRENGYEWARVIDSSVFDSRFPASNALYDSCDEITPGQYLEMKNYWLSPNNTAGSGAFFVVELNCEQVLNHVFLKNTQNGWHKDRGTKDFLVSLSNDKKKWIPVVYDSLPDVSGLSCIQRPLASTFKFKPQSAKFVRFDVMSFYGLGGGLDYFAVGG